MTQQTAETIEQVMRERHATKDYNKDFEISSDELNEIIELAATAPSAWNLQHWRFLVIQDQELKERIKPIAYGQQQITDASAVIVILGDLEANRTGHTLYNGLVESGLLSDEIKTNLLAQIDGGYQDPQFARDEANKNAALAAMQLMLAAKAKGYDSGPMGGYNPGALVEALNIPARYIPVMIVTLGKAMNPARPSLRLPLSDLIVEESF